MSSGPGVSLSPGAVKESEVAGSSNDPPASATPVASAAAAQDHPLSSPSGAASAPRVSSAKAKRPPSWCNLLPNCRYHVGHLGNCEERLIQILAQQPKGEAATNLAAAIRELGGVVKEGSAYDPKCTHVVMLGIMRSEKTLGALAAGRWLLKEEWVSASREAGVWVAEAPYEWHEEGDASQPFGREGTDTLWMGAPRAHRLLREQRGKPTSLASHLYVLSLDKRLRPDHARLKRILKAGGGRIWSEEALPPQENGRDAETIVLVPNEATVDDCALMRDALERGVACVPPEYVIEQLTQRAPRGVDAFLMR